MRFSIFTFISVQVILWSVFFAAKDTNDKVSDLNLLSDTWQVINITNLKENDWVSVDRESMMKITLNIDGTYVKTSKEGNVQRGRWEIDKENNTLLLSGQYYSSLYRVVQFPSDSFNYFIIKEQQNDGRIVKEYEYKLTRL